MSRVAIITARGGSKRIPRKNIRDFFGKPVIAYPIQAALDSGLFDEVMVSTEDTEIANIAIKYGAKVPFFRSETNSTDMAMTVPVLKEVIDTYMTLGKFFDEFCCIYPVSPLIEADDLKRASKILESSDAEVVVPVCRYSTVIQKSFKFSKGKLHFVDPSLVNVRSQDLEPRYFDIGQFYFCKTEPFLKKLNVFTPLTAPIEVDEFRAQDVDNETDWKMLEFKYAYLHNLMKA